MNKLRLLKSKLPMLFYFLRFIKPYKWKEFILIILMFLLSAGTLVSPYILKIIIDDVFPSQNIKLLLIILLIYLIISIARIIFSYISTYLFEWISNHIMKDLRMHLFMHLMKLPLNYHNANKKGDSIHRVNNEVNSIQSILTNSVPRLINSTCTIIGLVIMLSLLDLKLFLISLFVFPLIFLNTGYFQPKIYSQVKKCRLQDAEILSFILERLNNIRLLKCLTTYNQEGKKLSDQIDIQTSYNLRLVQLSSLSHNIVQFLIVLVPVFILGIGGVQVMAGAMTVGALVAFIQYMNRLYDPVTGIVGLYFELIRASVSMERIYEVIQIPNEEMQSIGNVKPVLKGKDIRFDSVCFAYNSRNIIENFNIVFESGKKYAIVGPSGCGKTTLVNLICRFYHPNSGNIYIGDINLSAIELNTLRYNITYIGQDHQLFNDTIKSNIIYGLSPYKDYNIDQAIKSSNIDKEIMNMPNGIETVIGDCGVMISGGQKQRLALSRVFLHDNDIIILDEATSAIDSECEQKIIENIFTTYPDKTIFIVSHRLCAIKKVDEIICLDNGRIIEKGPHKELISKKSFYWKLFNDQL